MRAGSAGSGTRSVHVAWAVVVAVGLAGCTALPREATRAGAALELAAPSTSRVIERDVPAPDVFQAAEPGLWDGRPSLGGVWVAHPEVRDPERVMIRNSQTGAEVVGALFRRERENPGPRFQISSEAAAALGILAGAPTGIEVVALRLERIEDQPAAPAPAPAETQATDTAATDAAAPAEAPRRTLRDLFRRQDAVPPAEAEAEAAPAAAAVEAPTPAGQPYDTVAITPVDAEPEAPRRSLRDLFRRDAAPEVAAPGIATTALDPVAPVAAPVIAAPAIAAPVIAAPSAPLAATALLSGDDAAPAPTPATDAPRRSLRDLFRRQPAEPAPSEQALIPIPAAASATALPAPAPAAAREALGRPFVQVGIFAVEGNATRTRTQMQAAGLPAEVRPGRSGERAFWRVVVGPATDTATQAELVRQVRAMGFADAYAVAN